MRERSAEEAQERGEIEGLGRRRPSSGKVYHPGDGNFTVLGVVQ